MKKIIKPGPKEINKFYRDNNIKELYNTKKIKIHHLNYKFKIKPYFILNDPYDLQTYNYNELLHNKIFDDISNFSKYIIIFLIKPIIEQPIIEYITEELDTQPTITQQTAESNEELEYIKEELETNIPDILTYNIEVFLNAFNKQQKILMYIYNKLLIVEHDLICNI